MFLHTLIVDGRVRPESSLLVVRPLELGQDGAGDGQTRDLARLGQLEAEALGVVVDVLDLGEAQGDEALVAAREGGCLGRRRLGDLGSGRGRRRGAAEEVVARSAEGARAGDEEERVGAALAGAGLGGVATGLLWVG